MKTAEEKRLYRVEQSRRLREKDRAAHNATHLKNYHRNRAERVEEMGGVCNDCGTTKKICITQTGLRCRSCMMKRRKKFTHGTYYGFRKAKCTCILCMARKLSYSDERNQKRRKRFRLNSNQVSRESWGQMRKPNVE